MTRLPGVRPRELVAALKRDGFVEHPGDVNRKLVLAILDQAGLTPEDLLRLL